MKIIDILYSSYHKSIEMIICSWNINGIKSLLDHDINKLGSMNIDILLVQEVRTGNVSLLYKLASVMQFPFVFYNLSKRSGLAGVAIMTRIPSKSQFIPDHILPDEGRILVVEFEDFCVVNLYSPYIGQDKINLTKRTVWESDILKFLIQLKKASRKVIIGGDLNVAPTKYDRYRVSSKQPGCSEEECNMYNTLITALRVRDAYREVHGEVAEGYTWGIHEGKLRLDYFLVDECNDFKITACTPIHDLHVDNSTPPSDHYPILLRLQFE